MLRKSTFLRVRDPLPDDTKAFYTWFSGQAYRQERATPAGYPAIRIYPVYGKRFMTGRTALALVTGFTLYGAWMRPERDRYDNEMTLEFSERQACHLPYQKAEVNLRYYITSYKRHRYEQENLIDKGFVGLTSEFRKFFYHDDVWRPDLHDVFGHPYVKFGGPMTSYNWATGFW
eukprot:GILI01006050.1.p1 GENE.GILI01006050.1~~GILI01006050.1.p1  ORF type:complete len:174 (+),score=33.26 GILI01006050.1:40-561(+)